MGITSGDSLLPPSTVGDTVPEEWKWVCLWLLPVGQALFKCLTAAWSDLLLHVLTRICDIDTATLLVLQRGNGHREVEKLVWDHQLASGKGGLRPLQQGSESVPLTSLCCSGLCPAWCTVSSYPCELTWLLKLPCCHLQFFSIFMSLFLPFKLLLLIWFGLGKSQ